MNHTGKEALHHPNLNQIRVSAKNSIKSKKKQIQKNDLFIFKIH